MTLPILSYMFEMAVIFPVSNLLSRWMHCACFKSCQKAVGSVNNLRNLHKIWVSFLDFFWFLFCFSESKKSSSAKRHFTFDPTSILLNALFFIIVHLNSMPSQSSSLVKYFGLINFTINFRSNGWISRYQRCIIGLSDWNSNRSILKHVSTSLITKLSKCTLESGDFDNLPTKHLTGWRKNESLWRTDIDWRKYLLFPDEK